MRIYFLISVHALKEKVDLPACSVSNFRDKAYAHINFFIHPIELPFN